MAFSMNSGYAGWSMSKNAVDAYRGGEKPFSKWTKTVLLDAIFEDKEVVFTKTEIKKYNLAVLKEVFLIHSSWHHTGRMCNITDFYAINEDRLYNHDDTLVLLEDAKERLSAKMVVFDSEKKEVPRKALLSFEQWEGNYWNYKHLKSYIDIPCYVYKDWAYTEKFGKKSLASNHVKEPKYLVRAPKGMAEDFKRIKESLPKTVKNAFALLENK